MNWRTIYFGKVLMVGLIMKCVSSYGVPLVTNHGLSITINPGLTATIQGGFTNQTQGASLGSVDNAGTIKLSGDWINNSNNQVFSSNTGTVELNGTSAIQTIGGNYSTGFYNLTFNNSYVSGTYQFSASADILVKNTLSMLAGIMELNGYVITIGTSAISVGAISRTAGWFKGGNVKRWLPASVIPDGDNSGYFPLGDAVNYRPIWISSPVTALVVGGTISISHTSDNTVSVVSIMDDVLIERRQNSSWNFAVESISGGSFDLNLMGGGYTGIGDVSDLRVTKFSTVVGNPGVNSGTVTQPEVKRMGISAAQLSGSFFIGSVNASNSPLPVTWLDFEVHRVDDHAQLYWSTASETNNDCFTIERSLDCKLIEKVSSIKGAGNSNGVMEYNGIDNTPYHGVSYYRIKQTDYDGKFDTTAWKMLDFELMKHTFSFNLYPNPLFDNHSLKILFEGQIEEDVLVVVNDVLGKLYFSKVFLVQHGEHLFAIDPDNNLEAGIYIVTGSSHDFLYSKKLVVK